MKIAIYSGTFDPIHTGHAVVANYISQFAGVDEVWVVVSRLNPFKQESLPGADDKQRFEMARLAVEGLDRVKVSDIELGMDFPSYSYRTLATLREKYPQHEFTLVVGADNWPTFDKWRNPDGIINEFGVIIYPRPGYQLPEGPLPKNVRTLPEAPLMEISSTFIRKGIAKGKNMRYFIPPQVDDHIKEHLLYTEK